MELNLRDEKLDHSTSVRVTETGSTDERSRYFNPDSARRINSSAAGFSW